VPAAPRLGALLLLVAAGLSARAADAPAALPAGQLKLALGPHTSMVYEPRRLPSPLPLQADGAAVEAAAPSLGLEFRTPSATRDGPRGLLRVQLSGDAALQLRPRRGGLAISYRTTF
jgi:hypothetical protein